MKFNVTDPTSGQTLTLEGDSPPSEDELNQIFAEHANRSAPPVLRDWQTGAVAQPVTGIPSDENVAAANRFSQQQLALAQLGADTTVAPEMPAERIRSGAAKGIVDWAAQQAGALKELSDVGEARPSFRRHEAALKRAGADFATEEQALSDLAQQQEQRRQAIKAPWVAIEKPLAEESAALKTVTGNVQGNEAATKFAESVSGMLPYVAEAAIPGVGPAAAVASGGLAGYKATLDQAADAYEQAGMSKTEARQRAHKDATRAGLVSAELFAALPGAGKSMAEKMIANRIANAPPVVQAAVNTLSASAQGGVVMGTQSLIDGAMAKWSYNPDLTWEQAIEEAAKSALSGAAATGVIHGTMEAARFAGQPKPPPDAGPPAAQEPPAQSTWRPTPPEFPPAGPPGGPPSGPSGGAPVLPVRERTPNAAIPINEQEGNVPRVAPRQDVPPNSDEIRQAQSGQAGGGDRAQPEAQGQAPPNVPVLTPQPNDFTRYNELTQQIKTAPAEQRQAIWQEIEAIKNRNRGLPPAAPEVITAAAYQDAAGNIHTAENHPAILDRLGIKGFETRESRNTPQFGFQTNQRPFISREEASKIEGYPAWHKLHSDEVPSPVEPSKPLGDVPQKEPWQKTLAEVQAEAEKRALAPRETLFGTRENNIRTTFEQLLADKKITKKQFDKERWYYGSQKMDVRAAKLEAKGNHEYAVKKALEAGKPVPPEVLADYPDIGKPVPPVGKGKPRMTLGKKKPVTETDDLNTGQSGQPQQAVPTVEQIPGVVKAKNRLEELIKKGEGNSVYANKLRVRIAELQKPKRIRVSLGLTGIKRFHAETALVGDDILDFINSSGKMMSDSEAKSSWSKEKYAQNKSQWDDKVRLLPHHNSAVYGGKRTPNEVAQEAFEAGKISEPKEPALWQAMGEASAKRQRVFETERKQEEWLKEKGKELQDWQEATKKKGGDIEVTNEQLAVGDMLEVEGERVEVTARDEDGTLTLKDGKKFGIQKLEDGGHLYVEKFEPAPEGEADFGPVEPRREDLALAPAESVEEQKARLAKEQADAQKKADRARLEREAAEGLKGTTGDLGQGDLLGGVSPELAKPADLFAPPAPVQKPPQVEKSAFPSLLEYAKSKLPAATAAKITSESQVESYRAQWEKEKAAAEKPEPPKETRTPAQILRQAERVKVRVPEGATMVRITDENGHTATAAVTAINKANTFRGVDIRKIEAGIIGRDKKFVVVPGEVTVEEPPRNLSLPSLKLSEEQAAMLRDLTPGSQHAAAFYSRITRTVEQSPQTKATGAQWKATIRNSKLGINADEYALVGVNDLEDGKSYTKQEVLDYLKANEVQVKDVTLGGGEHPINRVAIERMKDGKYRVIFTDNGEVYGEGYSSVEDARAAMERAASGLVQPTHFGQYTLPGAKEDSYREVLLTVPNVSAADKGLYVKQYGKDGRWGIFNANNKVLEAYDNEFNARSALRLRTGWNDGHDQYSSIPNPIVRIRLNERTTADGKRMLFLEEVQPPQKGEFEKMPALFQKNWREIAFKWALRHAVENGYDSVGWTTGEQQAERYDLSKQVSRMIVTRHVGEPEAYDIEVSAHGENNTHLIANAIGRSEFEKYIGKELAKRVSDDMATGAKSKIYSGLDLKVGGEGLKRLYDTDFRNVVNSLPVVKKSGQKVGTGEIKSPKEGEKTGTIVRSDDDLNNYSSFESYPENKPLTREEAAQRLTEKDKDGDQKVVFGYPKENTEAIHSLAITPDMREKIMAGQAQFHPGTQTPTAGRTFTTQRFSTTRQLRDAINNPQSNITQEHRIVLTKMLDAGLLDQLPGLRIEVADYIEGGATGEYLPNSRIARFLRWSDADVPVHEFFHDLYHFLSPEDQQFITHLRRHTVDREAPQMGEDFRNGLSSDEFLKRGINRDLYHLTNDSEFFTWMMTERAMAHFDQPEARTFGAKMRGIIRKLWTAFKDAFGLTPGEDRIWREIIGGKYEYTTGDAMEQSAREAALPNEREVTPENEDDANIVQVASRKYQVMDRGSFSAMQNARSDARTQDLFGKMLKLPGAIDTSKGRTAGPMDSNMIFVVKSDGFNYDAEGQKLLTELTQQIEGQHLPGGDAAYVTSLINAVTKNIVAGNFEGVFSQPLIEQLFQVVASERSVRGRMLRAITGMSEDLHTISRNANIYLKKLYASALGGDAISNVFKRVMIQFRDFFAADDFKEMQDALNSTDAGKKLGQFLDRLQEAMRSESGGRLYRILQGKYKPKQPLAPGQLEAKSFTNEEVAAVLEQMAKLGLTPKERPGKKKLTPMEELRLMVKETSIGRVEADVEKAIKDAERNAGLAAMIKAESIETDPDKKQALRDHIDLMNSDPRVEADEDYVEAGLNDPKFSHWRTIRDNWLGYSPTSLDMVQRVIKGDFKGTRFADGKERPADTRIDLNALAKEPQAEVQRVLDAYYDNVRRTVNMDGVSDATKQRVERMIREQVTAQLEAARKRVRDPMFALPKDPKAALTADQALAQKLNAGLFSDPRLDLPGMVELAASKGQVKRLVPKMNDLIKEIFATPVYRQEDLQKHFEDMLIRRFDVSPEDAAVAGRMFGAAFDTKFRQAKKRAAASAKQSLSPDERRIFAKRSLWEKIERATNSGLFDTGEVLRQIAKERGWNPPDDGTVRALRSASIREQQLRELTPKEIADLEAKGATPEQIEEARSRKEAATTYERAQLIKRMGDMWSFMTRPMPLTKNPGRMMKLWVEHRRNYAAALNELNTFNLLAKTGFTLYRLPMHLTTQLFGHLPTRAIARAMEIRKDDIAAGRHTQFLKDVGNALNDSAKSTMAAIRPALVAARAEMIGRGESRNVDRLLSGIHALDRLFNKANEYWAKGEYAKAIIGHFFAWPRVMAWYVSAIDHWQGTPVEYADIIHRVEMSMREQGRSRTEIDLFKNRVFDLMKNAITEGTAEARRVFEAEGIEASDAKLREAGWRVVRRDIYNEIKRVGLPGDDFEAENKILADTQSWQVPTKGGPGMIAAAPLQLVSRGLEWAGLPFSFGRFTNAIATSINYSLMWTPLYKLADVNWPKGEHSTWFGTEFDRSQRIAQAALGTAMGTTALALMAAGVLKITPPWILNKDERDEFERQGHKLNTAEFSVGDGKFIPVSMLVGPMTLIAPYMYFGGSLFRLMDKRKAAQAKLEKEAAARGVPAGKIRAISALDMLDIAAQTAWGAILGNRTVTGVREAASEYGTLNAQKQVANVLSVNVPGLPGWQEISRAMGVGLDKNLASIWDYMVPLPTSKARAVNMLGDPVGTPNDVQRVIQTMTSGTYPGIVDPKDRKETAYEVLYRTGYKPPTINPNKGYLINGEIRPMNDDELVKFTTLRGQYLKQALEANPEASAKDAKAAFQDANARALSDVGASSLAATRSGGETAGGPPTVKSERASTAGSAGRVSAPRVASVAAPAAGGGISAPRAPSLGGSRTRRMSLGRARAPKLVHGRIRIKRGSSLRGRDRIGVRKPRQRRRMSLA